MSESNVLILKSKFDILDNLVNHINNHHSSGRRSIPLFEYNSGGIASNFKFQTQKLNVKKKYFWFKFKIPFILLFEYRSGDIASN